MQEEEKRKKPRSISGGKTPHRLPRRTVHHRARPRPDPGGEAPQVAQVSLGRHVPRQRVGVPGDGPDDHHPRLGRRPARRGGGRALEVLEHQPAEQEVAEVVGAHGELEPVGREARLLGRGQVDRRVGDERVEAAARGAERVDERADRVERGEVEVHDRVRVAREARGARRGLGLGEVADGHDDVPVAWCFGSGVGVGVVVFLGEEEERRRSAKRIREPPTEALSLPVRRISSGEALLSSASLSLFLSLSLTSDLFPPLFPCCYRSSLSFPSLRHKIQIEITFLGERNGRGEAEARARAGDDGGRLLLLLRDVSLGRGARAGGHGRGRRDGLRHDGSTRRRSGDGGGDGLLELFVVRANGRGGGDDARGPGRGAGRDRLRDCAAAGGRGGRGSASGREGLHCCGKRRKGEL